MSKSGRKRKFDQKRKPSGDIKTVKNQPSNPVVLARRLAAAKDIRADAENPLSIMLYREIVTQDQHDAGHELAARYWRLFGKPFGRAADPNAVCGQDAVDAVRALQDEIAYEQAIYALDRCGRNTRTTVLNCCVHLKGPSTSHQIDRLRDGLQTLFELPRPRVNEDMKDRARAELAA